MAAEPTHPRPTLGRQDTARLLSVGEAADLAQVSHMTLRNAVRGGRMRTVIGRRRGRLLKLVRVEELARVYPEVLDRLLPLAVPVEIIPAAAPLGDAGAPGAPVVAQGEPLDDHGSDPAEGDSGQDARSEEDSADYLWAQLDQLREQVRSARDHNRRLFEELSEADREMRELRDGHERDERSISEAEALLALERHSLDSVLTTQRRTKRVASFSLAAALLTAAVSSFLLSRQGGTVWAAEPADAPPAGMTTHSPTVALPAHLLNVEGPLAAEPEVGPEPPPVEVSRATPETQPSELIVPAVFRGPVTAVEDPSDLSADASAANSSSVAIPAPITPVVSPGSERTDDLPCTYHARVSSGSTLRDLIGPCSGDWNSALSAVVGRLRVEGLGYCRQHHVIASTLGGSLERAQAEAEFSLAQGLIPPLVVMRIDNAAASFLSTRIAPWIESGFEAGPAPGHVVTELRSADAWRVDSWVRYLDSGGVELRRTFRVELVLGDGAAGDVLSSFDWTD